jgi:hypothetical protein
VKTNPPSWRFAFLLPNLQLQGPIEIGPVAFVPRSDHRLQELMRENAAMKLMVESTRTIDGRQVNPVAVLYDANSALGDHPGPGIFDARNCVALACVIHGWVTSVGCENTFFIRDTDYFDFFRRWPTSDGQNIAYSGQALQTYAALPKSLTVQPHPYIGTVHPLYNGVGLDNKLFGALTRVWRAVHIAKRARSVHRRVLRSLSIAYEACRVPEGMGHTLHDHGSHCALWVSALEALAHPGGKQGQVHLSNVFDLLGRRPLFGYRLSRRVSTIIRRPNKQPPIRRALNLVQRLYYSLYRARNAFIHGNPLRESNFLSKRLKKGVRLIDVAPLLYLVALEATLGISRSRKTYPKGKKAFEAAFMDEIFEARRLEDALEQACGFKDFANPNGF